MPFDLASLLAFDVARPAALVVTDDDDDESADDDDADAPVVPSLLTLPLDCCATIVSLLSNTGDELGFESRCQCAACFET